MARAQELERRVSELTGELQEKRKAQQDLEGGAQGCEEGRGRRGVRRVFRAAGVWGGFLGPQGCGEGFEGRRGVRRGVMTQTRETQGCGFAEGLYEVVVLS